MAAIEPPAGLSSAGPSSAGPFVRFLRNYVHFPALPTSFSIPGVGAIRLPTLSVFGDRWSALSKRTRWSILLGGVTLGLVALYYARRRGGGGGSSSRKSVRPRRGRVVSSSARGVGVGGAPIADARNYKYASVSQSIADSTSASVAGSIYRLRHASVGASAAASASTAAATAGPSVGIGEGDPGATSIVALDVNPQQLCQMGHECLEQAIIYWEDALDLLEYLPGSEGEGRREREKENERRKGDNN